VVRCHEVVPARGGLQHPSTRVRGTPQVAAVQPGRILSPGAHCCSAYRHHRCNRRATADDDCWRRGRRHRGGLLATVKKLLTAAEVLLAIGPPPPPVGGAGPAIVGQRGRGSFGTAAGPFLAAAPELLRHRPARLPVRRPRGAVEGWRGSGDLHGESAAADGQDPAFNGWRRSGSSLVSRCVTLSCAGGWNDSRGGPYYFKLRRKKTSGLPRSGSAGDS
jgi:hypothetical protein